ncbi:ADP-ribosylglycohydrolase family protein [Glutamicibacter uratoxydans]|uniref:ADP-ribosylglycohydrolase family protein n=1 Tax=Glutamicibacter uratoxydans TaxID=43667 RepID=UPI003D700945
MTDNGEFASLPNDYSDKVFAVLLGLADGAVHARDGHEPGATEILALFLADGLLEALEWAHDGVASDEAACMWLAGLRAYKQLTGKFPASAPEPQPRWIDTEFAAVERYEGLADGDPLNLAGLDSADMGYAARPTAADHDSSGVLPRAAVTALVARVPLANTAALASSAAFLTHGEQAAATAKAAALILRSALENGAASADSWDSELGELSGNAAESLRQVIDAVRATLGMEPTAAYNAYFGEQASEDEDQPATDQERDPEADAYAVALLAALHGSDLVLERPASAMDEIISELHERWMKLVG